MGRIARPSLLAQAVGPTIAAGLIEIMGIQGMVAIIGLAALGNLVLSFILFSRIRDSGQSQENAEVASPSMALGSCET